MSEFDLHDDICNLIFEFILVKIKESYGDRKNQSFNKWVQQGRRST